MKSAQNSPSNHNLQPWRIAVCTGATLNRLQKTLGDAFLDGKPLDVPAVPEHYLHYQQAHGAILYGPPGFDVPREDKKARMDSILQNFNNYGAPCLLMATIDKQLGTADVLSVGMYLQTLILLFSENGLASIPQVSLAGYGELIKKELDIDDNMSVLCGLAVGYADESSKLNKIRMPKDPWTQSIRFLE